MNKEKKIVEAIDEKAIIADIVAVWEKHGKPSIWSQILQTFKVTNPE